MMMAPMTAAMKTLAMISMMIPFGIYTGGI
jgi:hypothetical protein